RQRRRTDQEAQRARVGRAPHLDPHRPSPADRVALHQSASAGSFASVRRAARLTALATAFSEAVTMLSWIPTPHRTRSPTAASMYAAAFASAPAPLACSW